MAKKYFIKSSAGGLWPAFGLIWKPWSTHTAQILRNFTIKWEEMNEKKFSSRKDSYLIIVIFFTLTQFLELKFYTQMRVKNDTFV